MLNDKVHSGLEAAGQRFLRQLGADLSMLEHHEPGAQPWYTWVIGPRLFQWDILYIIYDIIML